VEVAELSAGRFRLLEPGTEERGSASRCTASVVPARVILNPVGGCRQGVGPRGRGSLAQSIRHRSATEKPRASSRPAPRKEGTCDGDQLSERGIRLTGGRTGAGAGAGAGAVLASTSAERRTSEPLEVASGSRGRRRPACVLAPIATGERDVTCSYEFALRIMFAESVRVLTPPVSDRLSSSGTAEPPIPPPAAESRLSFSRQCHVST
jgi:hypothetical protein